MTIKGKIIECKDSESGSKTFSASGRMDEEIEGGELLQSRGFSSIPKKGDEVLIIQRGNLKIAISTETKNRPKLKAGEAAVYTDKDSYIKINEDGNILIVSKGKRVEVDADLFVSGIVSSEKEITSFSKTKKITSSGHIHPTAVGPTSPATPGT